MPKSLLLQQKSASPNSLSEIVSKKIFIGNAQAAKNKSLLKKHKITHVLNCTPSVPNHFDDIFTYHRIGEGDGSPGIYKHFNEAIDFIRQGKTVLVHCQMGQSRSVTFVCAYLMQENNVNYEQALSLIKTKRPCAKPHHFFAAELVGWHEAKDNKKVNKRNRTPNSLNH